ncbi:MAG: 4'-phosphopantetheinyl transferase superfamily protein [Agrobacterium tumefaciens]|nr:4'-phosphopantetheinyl transferase superfamily protein [Agrobacterium tumefaciens]
MSELKMVDNGQVGSDVVVAIPVCEVLAAYDATMLLNEAEQVQAERFHKKEDSSRYQAAHVVKRLLIGAAVGKNAEDLHFSRAVGGKPILVNGGRLDFNLSHGGDWVAVALSWSGRIGVDVESEREDDFWREIASVFLVPGEGKNVGFLKLWTAKEAAAKANGAGLAIPLPEIVIDTAGSQTFVAALPAEGLSGEWRQLDAEHVLAVATDAGMPEICICGSASDLRHVLARLQSLPSSAAGVRNGSPVD